MTQNQKDLQSMDNSFSGLNRRLDLIVEVFYHIDHNALHLLHERDDMNYYGYNTMPIESLKEEANFLCSKIKELRLNGETF